MDSRTRIRIALILMGGAMAISVVAVVGAVVSTFL